MSIVNQINPTSRIILVIGFVCWLLSPLSGYTGAETGNRQHNSDAECRSCHRDVYEAWKVSKHNTTAYDGEAFQAAWEGARRSTECLDCHTTGFNPDMGTMDSAGVGCAACHTALDNGEFDPNERDHARMSIPRRIDECATCHGNDHALSYTEWEASAHNGGIGVGCLMCHDAHDTGLVKEDTNDLCGSCHLQPVPVSSPHMEVTSGCTDCHPSPVSVENVHMSGADGAVADCVMCHMVPEYDQWGRYLSNTGHTLEVTLAACMSCHGNLHDQQPGASEAEARCLGQNCPR